MKKAEHPSRDKSAQHDAAFELDKDGNAVASQHAVSPMPARAKPLSQYRMPEAQVSNPRKRRNPEPLNAEPLTPPQNKSSQHNSKKQKRNYPSGFQFPPAFWDNLSEIHLTKLALKELDRRNATPVLASRPPSRPSHRPTTRPLIPAADYLCYCETKDLKNIKRTARRGGPDLLDLRGFPEPAITPNKAMRSSQSSSRVPRRSSPSTSNTKPSTNTPNDTSTPTTTKSVGPYNRNFEQRLTDHGIYPHAYGYPDGGEPAEPNNWKEINQRLSQPRPSLSLSKFSEEAHKKFRKADAHARKEKQVTTSVIPIIEGAVEDARCVSGGIPFRNLDHLTDDTLVPGNPDIYYGARPEQLHRRVRDEFSGHIEPSTQDDLPVVPNFFMAAKGPDGSLAVADRQACYDGALGARGMHTLQSYGREDASYDNSAYTISSIYHGGTLKMFTSHPSQTAGPGSRPEYHMHQLRSFAMTDAAETFRQGATYYRNGRDWAKEQRNEAIRRANERARAGTPTVEESVVQASCFTSEATLNGPDTNEALSRGSRTSLTENCNTITHVQTSETSSGEPSVDWRAPVKRSSEQSKGSLRAQRKRHNAGGSDQDVSAI